MSDQHKRAFQNLTRSTHLPTRANACMHSAASLSDPPERGVQSPATKKTAGWKTRLAYCPPPTPIDLFKILESWRWIGVR